MMDILRWAQFIIATLGFFTYVVWFFIERRRVRYISIMWGIWCAGLIAFRLAVFFFPTEHTADDILVLNSLSNTLFLFGAVSVLVITIDHIIGAYRHGRNHTR